MSPNLVPHYYFHAINDVIQAFDMEGIDLADLEAARSYARISAREIIASDIRSGKDVIHLEVRIETRDGEVLDNVVTTTTVEGLHR